MGKSRDLADYGTSATKDTGTSTGQIPLAEDVLLVANDLSDLNSAPTARTNLGLGTAALDDTKQVPKVWINMNGTGTIANRDSFGVSSIVDNGVGDYTINFSTNFANTNYCPQVSCTRTANGTTYVMGVVKSVATMLVGSIDIEFVGTGGTLTKADPDMASLTIWGVQ